MLLHIAFNNWFWLIIAILFAWRITSLICYEAGPFDMLTRLRKAMFRLHMGGLVQCFHCMGFWIAALTALFIFEPGIFSIFEIVSISGGASIIERFIS
jgi:hypothetical protein